MGRNRLRQSKKARGSMIRRSTFREILGSMGRYLAILSIIALGVGFFTGLKITKTEMIATINEFIQEKNFYDFRLVSSLGFEQADVEAFRQEPDVRYAEGTYSFDALYSGIGERETALKTMSLPEHVNGIKLVSGRMPVQPGECVIDANMRNVAIGDQITLTDANEADTLDIFNQRTFTVVGMVQSSYYINFERGTTSIGNGKVSGFVYMEPEVFDCDYYTEVFVRFDQDYEIYSQAYKDYITEHKDSWETLCKQRGNIRYETLKDDAQQELSDARKKFEDQKADGDEKLAEAYQKIEDAKQELADGRNRLDSAWVELKQQEAELQEKENALNEQAETLQTNRTALQQTIAQLPAEQQQMLDQLKQSIVAAQGNEEAMQALQMQWEQLAPQMWQLASAALQLESAQSTIDTARSALEDGKNQLADARNTLVQKELELKDAQAELEQGQSDYDESKAEYDTKIADAEQELADAQEKIDELEVPSTYVLDRNTNIGYACFESDSEIVNAVAKVFPVFFILVAALVCMTTMNRMVEEQRTQIGTLKALGYSEWTIMKKFMVYSGSAALIGCATGYGIGTVVFPKVIWKAYGMMYLNLPLKYIFSWPLALISLIAALACSIGTTWLTCRHELQETAANLMRPKAPRAGKRIFLERIPFIWNHLKFLQKVSIRNVLRYKKRFFMMVIGISGCTALLLTGFGIKDSIADFAQMQYENIQILDGTVELKDDITDSQRQSLEKVLTEQTEDSIYVSESNWNLLAGDEVKSVNLVIPEETDNFDRYMNLHTEKQEPLSYPGNGEALINTGLAERYQIRTGDEIRIQNDEMQTITVRVAGIFENYVYNYVLMSADTYEGQLGMAPEYKTLYVNVKEGEDVHMAASELMKADAVAAVQMNQDTKERITMMMSSLNYIVVVVILCAAGLAFIVLYNLTNINITERIREIATVKVLGFFRRETETYVFRENMILTAIGSLVGLGLGVMLHSFVIGQIKVDMVSFATIIRPLSYIYSVVLTFIFYFLVNRVMAVKLEQINMAESLKSVD